MVSFMGNFLKKFLLTCYRYFGLWSSPVHEMFPFYNEYHKCKLLVAIYISKLAHIPAMPGTLLLYGRTAKLVTHHRAQLPLLWSAVLRDVNSTLCSC